MRVVLRNSDTIGSYKAAFLSKIIAQSAWKQKFFKLFENNLFYAYPRPYETVYDADPTFYDHSQIVFKSPVNDGWLNSNPGVAKFFFPTYTYGLQHFDGTLDHLWPVVIMLVFSQSEKEKFSHYLVVKECDDKTPPREILGAFLDDWLIPQYQSFSILRSLYFETYTYIASVPFYDELGNITYLDENRTGYRYFYYDLQKMQNEMSSAEFLEWFSVPGRTDQYVEYEDGGFFESTFGKFISGVFSLISGGPVGLAMWIGSKWAIEIANDILSKEGYSTSGSFVKEEMLWSVVDDDEYLGDDLMAVPPLPHF